MSKLFSSNTLAVLLFALPVAALADVPGMPMLSANSGLNLDTGSVVTSGGDILWDGTSLTPQGSAKGIDLTTLGVGSGSAGYSAVTSTLITSLIGEFGKYLSANAIAPAVNDVLVVHTNGGNYAKILVMSMSGGSITLEFDTFTGSSTSPGGPTINGIANNYSSIPAGLPSYGIAPGSLFVIYGIDLASTTNIKEAFPLATSLNGTSVSVTVNGTKVQPGLYYIYPTQVAAVLPSNTPTGDGTITVTNGTQTSAAFTIHVVQSAFGIDTVYGTGAGQAVVTDANYKLIGFNSSATPNQTVIIWGSGVGADTKNDDKTYPAANLDNLTNIPMQAYIGGVSANIVYRGRSQYPGVDQVVVTIPQGVAGCNVALVLVSGSGHVASNFTTMAVSQTGGACSDPNSPFDITTLIGKNSVNFGFLSISQSTSLTSSPAAAFTSLASPRLRQRFGPRAATQTVTNDASGSFENIQGAEFGDYASYAQASVGSCVVIQESISSGSIPALPFKETGLNAGQITVSGSAGSATLMQSPDFAGSYDASLSSSFITSQGGSFTFNASGGKIGGFSVTVDFGTPLFAPTNFAQITSITRADGVDVEWDGGPSGSYVDIDGYSENNGVAAFFYCLARRDDMHFKVPSWVTESLPAGRGSLSVGNSGNPVKFTATGLDFAYASTEIRASEQIPYN